MDNNRLTGSYYTSKRIAQYMVNWAIQNFNDSILEPSFGDGVFIDAALARYNQLGNNNPDILGVELQPTVYDKYMDTAPDFINGACQDYLTYQTDKKFSAIVGNPPYVSLRNLDEKDRATAIDCSAKIRLKCSQVAVYGCRLLFTEQQCSLMEDDWRLFCLLNLHMLSMLSLCGII